MRKLTPDDLRRKVENLIKKYPGSVTKSNLRYCIQLREIKRMPDANYCGVYWDKNYGIIVFIAGADKHWMEEHEQYIVSLSRMNNAMGLKRKTVQDCIKSSGIRRRGRPRKELTYQKDAVR